MVSFIFFFSDFVFFIYYMVYSSLVSKLGITLIIDVDTSVGVWDCRILFLLL